MSPLSETAVVEITVGGKSKARSETLGFRPGSDWPVV